MPSTCRDERDSEVLTSPALRETAMREDSIVGFWTRVCPVCKALLAKPYPCMSVVCQCGWQWKS